MSLIDHQHINLLVGHVHVYKLHKGSSSLGRALYRALLRQTLDLPPATYPPPVQETIGEHVVRRFREDARLQSPSQITHGLRAGYEALDLLQASANGSEEATTHVKSMLEGYDAKNLERRKYRGTLVKAEIIKQSKRDQPKPEEKRRVAGPPHPAPRNILADPVPLSEMKYPPSTGRRRIPHFVSTNNVPFLRYHKPQPKRLTGTIVGIMKTENNRWKARERMAGMIAMGDDEDQWDRLTEKCLNHSQGEDRDLSDIRQRDQASKGSNGNASVNESSWSHDTRDVDADVQRTASASLQERMERGKRMFEIALKERELAKIEKEQRKAEKHRLWMERQKGRKEGLSQNEPAAE